MSDTVAPLEITIDGKPVPWARHVGLGPAAHTPGPQKAYAKTIATAVGFGGARRIRGWSQYHLAARFFLPAPKDVAKADPAGVASEAILVDRRPDLDNWLKLVLDALNGIVWKDDAAVVSFDGSRRIYSLRPRLVLSITPAGSFDPKAATIFDVRVAMAGARR